MGKKNKKNKNNSNSNKKNQPQEEHQDQHDQHQNQDKQQVQLQSQQVKQQIQETKQQIAQANQKKQEVKEKQSETGQNSQLQIKVEKSSLPQQEQQIKTDIQKQKLQTQSKEEQKEVHPKEEQKEVQPKVEDHDKRASREYELNQTNIQANVQICIQEHQQKQAIRQNSQQTTQNKIQILNQQKKLHQNEDKKQQNKQQKQDVGREPNINLKCQQKSHISTEQSKVNIDCSQLYDSGNQIQQKQPNQMFNKIQQLNIKVVEQQDAVLQQKQGQNQQNLVSQQKQTLNQNNKKVQGGQNTTQNASQNNQKDQQKEQKITVKNTSENNENSEQKVYLQVDQAQDSQKICQNVDQFVEKNKISQLKAKDIEILEQTQQIEQNVQTQRQEFITDSFAAFKDIKKTSQKYEQDQQELHLDRPKKQNLQNVQDFQNIEKNLNQHSLTMQEMPLQSNGQKFDKKQDKKYSNQETVKQTGADFKNEEEFKQLLKAEKVPGCEIKKAESQLIQDQRLGEGANYQNQQIKVQLQLQLAQNLNQQQKQLKQESALITEHQSSIIISQNQRNLQQPEPLKQIQTPEYIKANQKLNQQADKSIVSNVNPDQSDTTDINMNAKEQIIEQTLNSNIQAQQTTKSKEKQFESKINEQIPSPNIQQHEIQTCKGQGLPQRQSAGWQNMVTSGMYYQESNANARDENQSDQTPQQAQIHMQMQKQTVKLGSSQEKQKLQIEPTQPQPDINYNIPQSNADVVVVNQIKQQKLIQDPSFFSASFNNVFTKQDQNKFQNEQMQEKDKQNVKQIVSYPQQEQQHKVSLNAPLQINSPSKSKPLQIKQQNSLPHQVVLVNTNRCLNEVNSLASHVKIPETDYQIQQPQENYNQQQIKQLPMEININLPLTDPKHDTIQNDVVNIKQKSDKIQQEMIQQAIRPISAPSKQRLNQLVTEYQSSLPNNSNYLNQDKDLQNDQMQIQESQAPQSSIQNRYIAPQNPINNEEPSNQNNQIVINSSDRQSMTNNQQKEDIHNLSNTYNANISHSLNNQSNNNRIVLSANVNQPILIPRRIMSIEVSQQPNLNSKISQKSIDSPINKVYSSKNISQNLRESVQIPEPNNQEQIRSSVPLSHKVNNNQVTYDKWSSQPLPKNHLSSETDYLKQQQRKNFFQKYSKTVEQAQQYQKDAEQLSDSSKKVTERQKNISRASQNQNDKNSTINDFKSNSNQMVLSTHMHSDINYDIVPQNTPFQGASPTFGPRHTNIKDSNQVNQLANLHKQTQKNSPIVSADQISRQLNKIVTHPIHHLHHRPIEPINQNSLKQQEIQWKNESQPKNDLLQVEQNRNQLRNIHEKYRFFYNDNSVNETISRMDKQISKYQPYVLPAASQQIIQQIQSPTTYPTYPKLKNTQINNRTNQIRYLNFPGHDQANRGYQVNKNSNFALEDKNIQIKYQKQDNFQKPKSPERAYFKYLTSLDQQKPNRFPSQNWHKIMPSLSNNLAKQQFKSAKINFYNQNGSTSSSHQHRITFNQNNQNYAGVDNFYLNNNQSKLQKQKIQIKLTPNRYDIKLSNNQSIKSQNSDNPIQKLSSQQNFKTQKHRNLNGQLQTVSEFSPPRGMTMQASKNKQEQKQNKAIIKIQLKDYPYPYIIKNNEAPFHYISPQSEKYKNNFLNDQISDDLQRQKKNSNGINYRNYIGNNNKQAKDLNTKYYTPSSQKLDIARQYQYKLEEKSKDQPKSYQQIQGKLNKHLYKQNIQTQTHKNYQASPHRRTKIILTIKDKRLKKKQQQQIQEHDEHAVYSNSKNHGYRQFHSTQNYKPTKIIRMNNNIDHSNQRDANKKSTSVKKIKLQLCKRDKYEQKKFKQIPIFSNPNKISNKQSPIKIKRDYSPIQQQDIQFQQAQNRVNKNNDNQNYQHYSSKGLNLLRNKDISIPYSPYSPQQQRKTQNDLYLKQEGTPKIVNKILKLGQRQNHKNQQKLQNFNEVFSQIQNEEVQFISN